MIWKDDGRYKISSYCLETYEEALPASESNKRITQRKHILEILKGKGLFAEIRKEKKRYFIAQSPEKILGILRLQKRELEEREREFIRIIAALDSKYSSKKRGGIQVFKGEEGLDVLEEQLLFISSPDIFVLTSEDSSLKKQHRNKIYEKIKKRLGKFIVQEKNIPELEGTLFFTKDKIIFISAKKQEGYLIDSPLVIASLKSLLR
ncbi:hypothetical protein IIC44_02040 [Patescibacteria group bacterium]|nr:hypothetical protein [Patescibacteria group bacterium]